jgi:hypothetical protein
MWKEMKKLRYCCRSRLSICCDAPIPQVLRLWKSHQYLSVERPTFLRAMQIRRIHS